MSFPGRILSSSNIFKPALHYLSSSSTTSKDPSTPRITHSDPDDIDSSPQGPSLRPWHSRDSSNELHGTIPLIDYSRTPSPNPYRSRNRSATQSEDEDEDVPASLRPLYQNSDGRGWWRNLSGTENLGAWLFGTWIGYQVWVGLLVIYCFSVGSTLVLMNRFILWTGTYKFPYPLAATWIQLFFTHGFLILFANITRWLGTPLRMLGFSSFIAPAHPMNAKPSDLRPRKGLQRLNLVGRFFSRSGGIAGGGLFEMDRKIAWILAPLAVVYVGKVVLSNISYAYAALPLYTLSRTPTIPIILLLTSLLDRKTHSIPTLTSTIIITLNLLIASVRKSERITWESIVAGVFSTLFSALYPILLPRAQKQLIALQVPQPGVLAEFPGSGTQIGTTREETRAYWTLLHYISLLSLAILTLMLLLSGELKSILHNCYFLDVPWFWFLTFMGGFASFGVFSTTLLFVRATSPLSTEVLKLPRQAAQMMVLERFRLPVHAWVGVGICYAGSLWYVWIRRDEGRRKEMRRIGGARR